MDHEMAVISPSVTAYTKDEYHAQMERIAHFATRIHIDLMDGRFTPKANLKAEDAWWPVGVKADFHLMYKQPAESVKIILQHKPNMIIVHGESDGDFKRFADVCHSHGVKVGVALLPRTPAELIKDALPLIEHVLIFSGKLGEYGGQVNLALLSKAEAVRRLKPDIEIGWDGGVSDRNISQLAFGGIDVFDVGGYIQSADDPGDAYRRLLRIAEETGTT